MRANFRSLALLVLFVLSTGSAGTQAATPAAQAASAPSSAASATDKFEPPVTVAVGDRIKLRSNVSPLTPLEGATGTRASAYTCLRVTRLNDDGGITVAVEKGKGWDSGYCELKERADEVEFGGVYKISADQLKNASYARYGWVYGPMVVPFKYFPHDRSFEPSQSLGMYMGYRASWYESRGMSFVGSAGLATMKVSQVVDDPDKPGTKVAKENTVAGYTVAFGVLFDLTNENKPFVAGLLFGRDYVGRNSALTYKHDGRPWVAFQVGWNL